MSTKGWKKIGVLAVFFLAASPFFMMARPIMADGPDKSHFPNVELITQDGKKVHFYDDLIKGKIVAIDLMYTTCHYACPLETARLAQVQKKLGDRVGKDIFFYSISIDPEHDTPEVLKAYMEKFHVGPGWTFLTGKKDDIIFLGRRLGIYTDASVNADGHVPHLLIGNEAIGQWMRLSALDNPSFQARMIGDFLDNFAHTKPAEQKVAADGAPMKNFNTGQYLFGQKPNELLDGNDPVATALLKKYNGVRMPNILISDVDAGYILKYLEEQTAAQEKQLKSSN